MELWIKHQAKSEARAKAAAEAAEARAKEAVEDLRAFCMELSMRQQRKSDEKHCDTQELIELEASKAAERHVEIKGLLLAPRGRSRKKHEHRHD